MIAYPNRSEARELVFVLLRCAEHQDQRRASILAMARPLHLVVGQPFEDAHGATGPIGLERISSSAVSIL
jgi:hypothetical protein